LAKRAARAAGQVLLDRLDAVRDISSKGFRDIVTDADIASQATILEMIRQHFPDHGILSEEGLSTRGDNLWVIDPLDGTVNYSRHLACFAVSIALVAQGKPVVGVVFDPLHDWLFAAERGAGATFNDKPLHVSDRSDIAQCVIGLDWARNPAVRAQAVASLTQVAVAAGTMRAIGSAALAMCYVAAGWLDGYFHFALQPWDSAAAGLIISEAGGMFSDPAGKSWSYTSPACVASNGLIHSRLLNLMQWNP
jgi:myo-inositol-1(or 4)-monophosphatase